MKIIDPRTNQEIEVFTTEDLNKKIEDAKAEHNKELQDNLEKAKQEAIDEYKKQNPDQTDKVTDLEKKLADSQAALESAQGSDGKDGQVERLRKERDDAKAELANTIGSLSKEISSIKTTLVGNVKEELLKRFAGDDKEKRAKIEKFYDDFKGEAVTKEEIAARMDSAVLLATGTKPTPGALDGAASAGARGDGNLAPKTGSEPTANEVAIGTAMGITPEIREKYSPKTN